MACRAHAHARAHVSAKHRHRRHAGAHPAHACARRASDLITRRTGHTMSRNVGESQLVARSSGDGLLLHLVRSLVVGCFSVCVVAGSPVVGSYLQPPPRMHQWWLPPHGPASPRPRHAPAVSRWPLENSDEWHSPGGFGVLPRSPTYTSATAAGHPAAPPVISAPVVTITAHGGGQHARVGAEMITRLPWTVLVFLRLSKTVVLLRHRGCQNR